MLIENKTIWTPDNSFLLEYKAKAETGEIVLGQELKIELSNLEEDLKDDRYFYNTDDANLRMNFMQNCIRLTKSPYYNKPMVLMLWQKALIEAFYSFKMAKQSKEKGITIDRFKKLLLLIARKNCKSETSSALGNAEFIVGNAGADIVASSNDDAQASIVYDAIDTMRTLFDPNNLDTKRNQRFILNKVSNTKIFKLSDRTKNKEGRNIDFAIIDETHEMKDNVIAKSIEQSQSLKINPKFINITTEGFVIDGYLDEELKKARAIINGEVDDVASERFLPWLYTQDSESEVWNGNRQNRLWMKSNPTLNKIKSWDYLEEQVALARQSKADRIFVLSKDFNIKQNSVESWLNLEDYDYECVFDLEDFRGAFCLGAVDLAETTDLCSAKILLMKPNDNRKYIYQHYFIPQSKLEKNDDKKSGANYVEWAKAGLITIDEDNEVDLAIVADWFYMLYDKYKIRLIKCGYDQRFAKEWLNRMEFYGWQKNGDDSKSELVMILQNAQTLSNAIKLCEADFKHKLIYYNNNPIDKWNFGNCGLYVDNASNCLLVKNEATKRIDGAVSLAILYETYRRYRGEFKKLVERGTK